MDTPVLGDEAAAHPHGHLRNEVVVEVVPERIFPVRDEPLHRERLFGGVGDEVGLGLQHRVDAVLLHEFEHAPLADAQRREHRLDVPEIDLGGPAIRPVEG